MNRRLKAALIHHNIDRRELKGWFYFAAPKGIKLAEMHKGTRQIGRLENALRDAIARRRPDIIGLDPFVKLHALEENDNGAMDFVCDLLTRLAIEHDIAVDAPHHTKKGALALVIVLSRSIHKAGTCQQFGWRTLPCALLCPYSRP